MKKIFLLLGIMLLLSGCSSTLFNQELKSDDLTGTITNEEILSTGKSLVNQDSTQEITSNSSTTSQTSGLILNPEIKNKKFDSYFELYNSEKDLFFKKALIINNLNFITIPNHDSQEESPIGVLDGTGGYQFTLSTISGVERERWEVCEVLKILGDGLIECPNKETGTAVSFGFQYGKNGDVTLTVEYFTGLDRTNKLLEKTYKILDLE